MKEIENCLFNNSDEKFREFNKKLVPDTSYEMIGVKLPVLRGFAKTVSKDKALSTAFLKEEHHYYEEWFLHGLIIAQEKENVSKLLSELKAFMPHIDNWAICDSVVASLKAFKKDETAVLDFVRESIDSDMVYAVRFGIVTLLDYFIKEEYLDEILRITLPLETEEYYINMAIAWLYSVMLVKYYDFTIKIFETRLIKNVLVHNKAIQKARESLRVSDERKKYLYSLKIK